MYFVDGTSVPSTSSLKPFYFFNVFQVLVELKSLNSVPFGLKAVLILSIFYALYFFMLQHTSFTSGTHSTGMLKK